MIPKYVLDRFCPNCGNTELKPSGGCSTCFHCDKCKEFAGCFNLIGYQEQFTEIQMSYAEGLNKHLKAEQIKKFTDEELQEELKRRAEAKLAAAKKIYDACQHDWQYWSDYYSKGRDCKKCGKQE